jgi:hypothetical protein
MGKLLSSNLPCRGPRSHAGSASGDPSGTFVQIHHFNGIGCPALVAQAIEQAPGNHLHGGHLAPHAIVQAGPVGAVQFFFFGELPSLHFSHTKMLSSACRSVCGGTSYTDRWSAALHNSQAWPLRAIRVSSKLMFKIFGRMYFPLVNGDADNSHLHFCEPYTSGLFFFAFLLPSYTLYRKKRHSNCPLYTVSLLEVESPRCLRASWFEEITQHS